jgi:hypothetical protein
MTTPDSNDDTMTPTTIAIEKNIPLPDAHTAIRRTGPLPWRQMEVGDSFMVTGEDINKLRSRLSAGAAYIRRQNASMRFSTRRVAENAVRVWRIA